MRTRPEKPEGWVDEWPIRDADEREKQRLRGNAHRDAVSAYFEGIRRDILDVLTDTDLSAGEASDLLSEVAERIQKAARSQPASRVLGEAHL